MKWCIGPRPSYTWETPPKVKKTMAGTGKKSVPHENSGNSHWKHQHVQEGLLEKNWRWILCQRFFEQEWPYQPDTNRQQTSARKNQTEILVPRPRTTDSYQRRRQPHEHLEVQSPSTAVQKLGWHGPAEWWSFLPFSQQELTQYLVKVVLVWR